MPRTFKQWTPATGDASAAGACQAAPSSAIKRRGPAARAHLRRMSGADGGLSFASLLAYNP
jgi:hypothetical protein